MIIKNLAQKRILFAENGIDRWNAPIVAKAIIRRIAKSETIIVNKFDIEVINRMAEVLHTGRKINNPFLSIATELTEIEIDVREILAVVS